MTATALVLLSNGGKAAPEMAAIIPLAVETAQKIIDARRDE